eukprot:1159779-Pelagomonas_calceolata.AAC.4
MAKVLNAHCDALPLIFKHRAGAWHHLFEHFNKARPITCIPLFIPTFHKPLWSNMSQQTGFLIPGLVL